MRLTTILRASVLLAALATGSFGGADLATLAQIGLLKELGYMGNAVLPAFPGCPA